MTGMVDLSAPAFRADVENGLAGSPKAIPGKYIWDDRGSQIFEEITRSGSYYPMEAEMALLSGIVGDVAETVGAGGCIVEFGSGASRKVRTLLAALEEPTRYIALDISADFASRALQAIERDYPGLEAVHVTADYSRELPPLPIGGSGRILGYLPGTSIGNMTPEEAIALLRRIRAGLGDSWLLIGQDPNQDSARLLAAYGSPEMAELHENLLRRMQRELGAELDPGQFSHEARVSGAPARVEAHLVARNSTDIKVGGKTVALAKGETINTDVSLKYPPSAFHDLARTAGWTVANHWVHSDGLFALHLLKAA